MPSAVKDLLPEDEDERVLPDFVDVEDDVEDDEEDDVEEVSFSFAEAEESPSRVPHVSAALSSTSWAERDTEGFLAFSPGSSIFVSSYGVMRSSMNPIPLSPGPAKAADVRPMAAVAVRMMCFMMVALEMVRGVESRSFP